MKHIVNFFYSSKIIIHLCCSPFSLHFVLGSNFSRTFYSQGMIRSKSKGLIHILGNQRNWSPVWGVQSAQSSSSTHRFGLRGSRSTHCLETICIVRLQLGFFFRTSALLSTERLQTHVFTTITKIFVQ